MAARQRALVVGAGAIGQFLGGRLHEAGHDVVLMTTQRHVEAFARDGLCVRGESNYCWTPEAITQDGLAEAGVFDVAFVTSKAYHTADLAQATAPALRADGIACTLQNGLGNWQKLARSVPAGRVVVASTSHGVTVEAPGHLLHAGIGGTLVAPPLPDATGAARKVQALLEDAKLEPGWADDARGILWRKAIINHGLNPVAALHDVPNGGVLDDERLLALGRVLVREATELARRARVQLPAGDLEQAYAQTLDRTRGNVCSMVQDARAKRPTEVEQITGRFARLAEALLVSMPRSEAVYGRVKDLEASYMGPDAATRMAWDELPWEREPF